MLYTLLNRTDTLVLLVAKQRIDLLHQYLNTHKIFLLQMNIRSKKTPSYVVFYFCLQFRNNLEMFLGKLFDKIDEWKYQMKVRDTLNKKILVS